jgi:hypothetical protein
MNPKSLYLVLSVLGFLLPYTQFAPWVGAHGVNLRLFWEELTANRIGMFFGWVVIVSAVVLFAFMRMERRRKAVKHWWLPIAGTLLVGVSFGFPLFLYLREDSLVTSSR